MTGLAKGCDSLRLSVFLFASAAAPSPAIPACVALHPWRDPQSRQIQGRSHLHRHREERLGEPSSSPTFRRFCLYDILSSIDADSELPYDIVKSIRFREITAFELRLARASRV